MSFWSGLCPKRKQNGGTEAFKRFTKIATQTYPKIGREFFHVLTRGLAEELHAPSVYVGEFQRESAGRVRTLALCVGGDVKPDCDFPLRGTPEAEVARCECDRCIYESDLQSKYPSDIRLSEWNAQECVQAPLIDSEKRRLGLVSAFFERPLREEVEFVQWLLAMFVPRVLEELSRKQSEDKLRESEERYRAFVGLNPDPMWRIEFSEPIDIDQSEDDQVESIIQKGRLAECNVALARLLGKEHPEELVGGTAFEILPAHLHDTYRHSTEEMVRSKYRFATIRTEGRDIATGKPRWFLRTHWGIYENRKLLRIWGVHHEITELKEAQIKLSELVETLHLAAIELDRGGALKYCNEYLLKLTGWRKKDIIDENWFDKMVPQAERQMARQRFSTRTKVPCHFSGHLLCPDGSPDGHRILVGWDYVVIRDANDRIVRTVGACRDLIDYADLDNLPPRARLARL